MILSAVIPTLFPFKDAFRVGPSMKPFASPSSYVYSPLAKVCLFVPFPIVIVVGSKSHNPYSPFFARVLT